MGLAGASRRWCNAFGLVLSLALFTGVQVSGAQASGAQASGLRIVTVEEPPTNYIGGTGLTGTSVDIVHALAERLGLQPDIEVLPPARALQIASTQPGVVLFTAGKTEKRIEQGFTFIGPVITRRHALYAKSGTDIEVQRLEDVSAQGLVVSGIRGDWRVAFLEERGIEVAIAAEHVQNFKKTLLGRSDLFISSDVEVASNANAAAAAVSDFQQVHVFREAPSYILFSKGTDPAVIAAWQAAYAALVNDQVFVDSLTQKWSRELRMPLNFTWDRGLHSPVPQDEAG